MQQTTVQLFDSVVASAVWLLPILGGAALTAVAGLIGAWIQHKREHSRWVRERRFEAYREWLRQMSRLEFLEAQLQEATKRASEDDPSDGGLERLMADTDRVAQGIPDVLSEVKLVGPNSVTSAMESYIELVTSDDPDDDALDKAEAKVLGAIHTVLAIPQERAPAE